MLGIFGEFSVVSVSRKQSTSSKNSEQSSVRNRGRTFQEFRALSLCNFSDLSFPKPGPFREFLLQVFTIGRENSPFGAGLSSGPWPENSRRPWLSEIPCRKGVSGKLRCCWKAQKPGDHPNFRKNALGVKRPFSELSESSGVSSEQLSELEIPFSEYEIPFSEWPLTTWSIRNPQFSEQLSERFPELPRTHPKNFHLPLHSRSVFSRIGVVPAHQKSSSPISGHGFRFSFFSFWLFLVFVGFWGASAEVQLEMHLRTPPPPDLALQDKTKPSVGLDRLS